MRYSPTGITIFNECCPCAFKLYQQRRSDEKLAERDCDGPRSAEIGIAFHFCAQAAASAVKAGASRFDAIETAARALSQRMSPVRVREGADHCLEYVKFHDFNTALDYEHGVAFTQDWKQTGWEDGAARLRLIFDGVGEIEDYPDEVESITGRVAYAFDYKTGWGVSEDDLNSVQMCAYSTALQLLYPEAGAIRIDLVATRFNRTFTKVWDLGNQDDVADLDARKRRLEFFMDVMDKSEFKPRVGVGCGLCDFTHSCEAFKARLESNMKAHALGVEAINDVEAAARDMALLDARIEELKTYLKSVAKSGYIEVDGKKLGFHPRQISTVVNPEKVVDLWFQSAGDISTVEEAVGVTKGLLRASDIGVTSIEKIIGKLSKTLGYKTQKEAKEHLSSTICEKKTQTVFCWK